MDLRSIIVAAIVSLLSFWYYKGGFGKIHSNLIIGVLSSRENFAFRNILREIFNHQIENLHYENVTLFFIVGSKDCLYPSNDRLYQYSCVKWNIEHKDVKYDEVLSLTTGGGDPNTSCIAVASKSYSFEVGKFAIRIRKLGILSSALVINEPVFVLLTDAITNDVYARAKFSIDFHNQTQMYFYVPVDEYIYPANFKGRLTIKGRTFSNITLCNHNVVWDSAGNLISFNLPRIVAIPAISYLIHNSTELKDHIIGQPERFRDWKHRMTLIKSGLIEEQAKFSDLVFVDTVDVYRNLPQKIIKFAQWLDTTHSFDYFLKMDDDCILNIKDILQDLQTFNRSDKKKLWWGNFRKEWPVNKVGKWADSDYPSSSYPWFACGSANVLSSYLVSWLAKNQEDLHEFQGEDVSLGIWLNALNPDFVDDKKWSCDAECMQNSYVRAQLSLEDLLRADNLLEECGSICSCD